MSSALLSGDPHDQLGIAYNLIVDNKRIEDETSKLDIKDFYVASSPPPPAMMLDSPARPQSSASSHRQRMSSGGNSDKGKGTPMKRAKWHLGIRSQSKPHDIMHEVYRAMKALDFVSYQCASASFEDNYRMFLLCGLGVEDGERISRQGTTQERRKREANKDEPSALPSRLQELSLGLQVIIIR